MKYKYIVEAEHPFYSLNKLGFAPKIKKWIRHNTFNSLKEAKKAYGDIKENCPWINGVRISRKRKGDKNYRIFCSLKRARLYLLN